jgi:hypothetical protein
VDSSILGDQIAQNASFFAQSYTYSGSAGELTGTKIISYRGNDNTAIDAITGYPLGAGDPGAEQAIMAAEFYRDINGGNFDSNPNIALTGHSLGGGLAGFVGTLYGEQYTLFDNMSFEGAATDLLASFGYSALRLSYFDDAAAKPAPIYSTSSHGYFVSGEFLQHERALAGQQTGLTPP